MRESMMTRLLVMMALTDLTSCSASAERPPLLRDPTKSSALGVFMKTRMNPPFSKISFLLFHDGDSDAEIDASDLPASALALAGTAERLGKWPELPGESPQSKLVFSEYAESLKNDTRNLISALQSNRHDAAIKVFESIHKKCDACHHFFRYDETTSMQPHPPAGGSR
jgi:hypothetical protein